jgi:hypothetical protein
MNTLYFVIQIHFVYMFWIAIKVHFYTKYAYCASISSVNRQIIRREYVYHKLESYSVTATTTMNRQCYHQTGVVTDTKNIRS